MKNKNVETELTSALSNALVALGRAGRADDAMRIAGRAFADVRRQAPRAAEQLNNVMHGLAKMPSAGRPETKGVSR